MQMKQELRDQIQSHCDSRAAFDKFASQYDRCADEKANFGCYSPASNFRSANSDPLNRVLALIFLQIFCKFASLKSQSHNSKGLCVYESLAPQAASPWIVKEDANPTNLQLFPER